MDEKKRQSLVLGGVALIVVCVGGFEVFNRVLRKDSPGRPSGMDAKQMLTLATQAVTQTPEGAAAERVFAMGGAPWNAGAFFRGKYLAEQAAVKQEEIDISFDSKEFIYSGYLRAGEETIAIINGIDYKPGEKVKDFTIEKITEDFLVLGKFGKKFEVKIR